jgi:hypothetical protein
MKKKLNHIKQNAAVCSVLFSFFIFNNEAFSQTNLVPNPSFEQYTNCPYNRNLTEARNGKPNIWFKPDHRYASYLNACSNDSIVGGVANNITVGGKSFQVAKSGNAYIAMYHFGSILHYFEVKLLDSLRSNKKYYGECYVSLVNTNITACNSQSMYFSKQAVYVDTANCDTLLRNPQVYNYDNPIIADTLNWVKVSGVFTAQGGEQYLTLGNFRNSYTVTKRIKFQNTGMGSAFYYYDDIAVYNLDSFCLKADAGRDTAITPGDSVFLGSYTNGIDSLKWQIQNNNTTIDSTRPGFWVHPTVTTSYVLQQVVNGCFSSDTVNVTVGTVPLKFISYNLASSLRGTKQSIENIWTTANEINVSHFNIQRSTNGKDFTTTGKLAAQNKITNEYNFIDNELPITNDQLTIYYRVESVDFDGKKQYSTVQQINIKHQTPNIAVFPNPAKDFVTIISQENIKLVKIINQLSQIVQHQTPNTKQITINTKQFAKGLYIIQITNNKGEVNIQKLIVE